MGTVDNCTADGLVDVEGEGRKRELAVNGQTREITFECSAKCGSNHGFRARAGAQLIESD